MRCFRVLLSICLVGSQLCDFAFSRESRPSKTIDLKIANSEEIVDVVERVKRTEELTMTGKSFLIGYTEDMRKLAYHGERALPKLTELVDDASLESKARVAALLTVHLIGVDGKIFYGQREAFQIRTARQPLLHGLKYTELVLDTLLLLIRDPFTEDVPELMKALEDNRNHSWAIVKSLQRYDLDSSPVHQRLSRRFQETSCRVEWQNGQYLTEFVTAIEKAGGKNVIFDFDPVRSLKSRKTDLSIGFISGSLGEVVEEFTGCTFDDFGKNVDYYIEKDVVHFCEMEAARLKWLDWYSKGPVLSKRR